MYELSAIMMNHNTKVIDSSASNLANIQTPGYHAERYDVSFSQMVDSFAVTGTEYSDLSQGSLKKTSNQSSFAIENGQFQLREADSQSIKFKSSVVVSVNSHGYIEDSSGASIMGANGAIFVGDQDFNIDSSGSVLVDGRLIDELSVVGLDNMAKESGSYSILKGYSEASNVDSMIEIKMMLESSQRINSIQSGLSRYDSMIALLDDYIGEL